MENDDTFGSRLHQTLGGKGYREIKDFLNQNGLAIDYDSIRRYILEQRRPDYETLIKISEITGSSLDWLLKGEKQPEEKTGVAFKIWEKSIWSQFSLDESTALKSYADHNGQELGSAVHNLATELLKIYGFIDKPVELPFLSAKDLSVEELYETELFGEITDYGTLIPKQQIVKVPKRLRPPSYILEDDTILPERFHAYLVATEQLNKDSVGEGDLIVAGNFATMFGWVNWVHNSQAMLIRRKEEQKLLLRRVYRNPMYSSQFLYRPVQESEPIEGFPEVTFRDFEYIFAIITK